MRKISISIFLCLFVLFSYGQSSFGLKGGVNISKIKLKNSTAGFLQHDIVTNASLGGYVGGYYDLSESSRQSTNIGVVLQYNAGKLKTDGENLAISLLDLEIPLDFIYRIDASTGKVVLGLGPFIAYNLKTTYKQGGVSQSYRDAESNFLSRLDYGVNALVGYRLPNGLSLNVGYRTGLKEYFAHVYTGSKTFSIGLGYDFLH